MPLIRGLIRERRRDGDVKSPLPEEEKREERRANPSRRGGLGMTSGRVHVAKKRNGRNTEVRRPFLIFVK